MSPGWTAVIGVSVAVMAVVQIVVLIGLAIAWQRMQAQVQALEQRVQSTVDSLQPELISVLDQARTASSSLQALAGDLRDRLDSMDEAARSVRARVSRVADTVQWAATNLPLPVRVSGPAAVAAWTGVRVVRNLMDRARLRRLARRSASGAKADATQRAAS